MAKKTQKVDLIYVGDVAFGGEIMPTGTKIGSVELPEACNPAKLRGHVTAGHLAFVYPDPDADAELARKAPPADPKKGEAKK